jgi:predicted metal-dependent HD superfamily phosphohydrolase
MDLAQWKRMWEALGAAPADEALLQDLVARYSEPHRRYHTMQHIRECFGKLQELRALAREPQEIELALWFHDAIYDTRRHDNEEKSAQWARATVLEAGLPTRVGDRVYELVMVTRHNAVPTDMDQQVLVDVDLSILGASPERFDEYGRQVREEYSWVPGPLFRRERRKILEEFLKRRSLFQTAPFVAAYEARARDNLKRSLEKL